ncbi:O-antigen ligase family protein [Candidatus Dojkabacteria bacterium]|nr:O-antigen ligase family protein [Candidatus Dojkabacteria bacterium]
MKNILEKYGILTVILLVSFSTILTTNPVKWLLLIPALIISRRDVISVIEKHVAVVTPWILYILYCCLSLIWTVSVPISLVGLIDQVGYFLFLILVLTSCQQIGYRKVLNAFCIYISFLIVLNIGLMLSPINSFVYGPTDFLLPAFGHNHLGSVAILLLPLAFYSTLIKFNRFNLFFLTLLLITLVSSGGRVLLSLGLVQLIFVYFRLKKNKKTFNPVIKNILTISCLAISSIIIWYVFFSGKTNLCNDNSSWWCKKMNIIDRKAYFISAIKSIVDKPLFGSGLNTYSLMARKYAERPGAFSYYAHSYPLQLVVELGLMGLFVFSHLFKVIISKIHKSINNYKRIDSLKLFLTVGIIFSLLNSMLDYDWNVPCSFLFVLMVSGLILAQNKEYSSKIQLSQNTRHLLTRVLTCVRIIILVFSLIVCVYFLQAILIALNKPNLACKIFAGNRNSYEQYLSGRYGEVSTDCLKKTEKYFFNDPFYWQFRIDGSESESASIYAHLNIIRASPWHSFSGYILEYYIKNNQPESAKKYIDLLIGNFQKLSESYSFKDWQLYKFTPEIIRYGDYLFSLGNFEDAGKYHYLAYQIDPWAFSYKVPAIANRVAQGRDEKKYYDYIKKIPSKYLLEQSNYFSDYYMSLAILLSKNNDEYLQILDLVHHASQLTNSVNIILWNELLSTYDNDYFQSLFDVNKQNKKLETYQLANEMVGILKSKPNEVISSESNKKETSRLAKYFTNLGRIALSGGEIGLAYNYSWSATRFLNEQSPAFSQVGLLCESMSNFECAEQEYLNCLELSKQKNNECKLGLERVVTNKPNTMKYWAVVNDIIEN